MTPIRPVVLCGGAGTRLWPLSRPDRPKPLLRLAGGATLLEDTLSRVAGFGAPTAICGSAHAAPIRAVVPDLSLVVEPIGRGTALAAAVAATVVARQDGPDALVLLLPSDHAIRDVAAFRGDIVAARASADLGSLVTFGVVADRPATGFGWIAPGASLGPTYRVERFVEKPSPEVAATLLAAGLLWNSGIFLFRADALLEELERYAPRLATAAEASVAHGRSTERALHLAHAPLEPLPNLSLDVAVFERTERAAVRPVSIGWSDLGTFSALREHVGPTLGPVSVEESPGSFVASDGPTVVVVGVPDVVVVASGDHVLVVPVDRSDDVGRILARRVAPTSSTE